MPASVVWWYILEPSPLLETTRFSPSVMPFAVFDEQDMNFNAVNFINLCFIIRFLYHSLGIFFFTVMETFSQVFFYTLYSFTTRV